MLETDAVPRWKSGDRGSEFADGKPPTRGISDLVAVALIALDLDVVRRHTIRLLLPEGERVPSPSGGTRNQVRDALNRAWRRFEHIGWITRDGDFIRIHDRDGLRSWIEQGVDLDDERAATMLEVQSAVAEINARLDEGTAVSGWDAETARRHAEVRRQELIALDRLMRAIPGGTARPGVRITPRGRAL